jgi:D-alanine--D-alanine ligase
MRVSKKKVLVLFGGQSSEHQISCATAAGVLQAIDRQKWDVLPVGITLEGEWVLMPDDPSLYGLQEGGGYTVPRLATRVHVETGSPAVSITKPGEETQFHEIDVVFPLLHGPWGEDGTLQGLLEMSHIRYVGCGVAASAVAMDKYLTKAVLSQADIEVGAWEYVSPREWKTNRPAVLERLRHLGFPAFVKPCRAGSSMGITRVSSFGELEGAIEAAQAHDPRVLVEAANPGREIECGVLGLAGGQTVAAPLGEIQVVDSKWYDYETKYFNPDGVSLRCPAEIPADISDAIRNTALRAFEVLELEGLSRIDFFFDEATGSFAINEVNTLPGFTPFSMYPTMLAKAGFDYPSLVQALLEEAMSRPVGLR